MAALLVLPLLLGVAVPVFGIALEPDASYFTGGISLFPSPVGTVIGTAGGYRGLAFVNGLAAAVIIVLVALIARELGGRPLVAQGAALLLAPAGWFTNWGMDAPAVAVLLAAVLFQLQGRSRLALAGVVLAAAMHLAALPLALGALIMCLPWKRGISIAAALAAAAVGLALVTPYRAAFRIVHEPLAFIEGAHELLLACWPLFLLAPVASLHPRLRPIVLGAAAGAIVAGAIPASVGQEGVTRYAIPCIFIAAAGVQFRNPLSRFRRRTHPL